MWQFHPGMVTGRGALDITTAFTPASLSPALWVEARNGVFQSNAGTTAATADTNPVGYITDLSGNGFHLTSAADDGTRPLLGGVGVNPYLDFVAANSTILRRTASLGMYAAGACSIFVAARANPAASAVMVGEGNTATTNTGYLLMYSFSAPTTSRTQLIRDDVGGSSSGSGQTASFFDNTDKVLGVTDDSANIIPYINTSAQTTRTYTRPGGAFNINRFGLGGWQRNTASNYFTTRIYGVVIVNRVIDSTERGNLITYLGNLAGLSL